MSIDTQNQSFIIASSLARKSYQITNISADAILSEVIEVEDIASQRITYQPISSNMVYESKDVVRIDYVIQATYTCQLDGGESDDCVRYFDTLEKALLNNTYQTTGTNPAFYYRVVKFVHNSPVNVNRYTSAEGLMDTEQDEESMLTRSTCLIYVSRWLEIVDE